VVTELGQAHTLLAPLLGTSLASLAFAVALLFAGQSSTLTGTLAGQVVMEGFLEFRMRPWLRRLVTRSLALVPAVLTIAFLGDRGTYQLLILSQVVLSLQLPFAVIPLVRFTGDRARMREFASGPVMKALAWTTAAAIVFLNVKLVASVAGDRLLGLPPLPRALAVLGCAALGGLLLYVTLEPFLRRLHRRAPAADLAAIQRVPERAYRRVAAALAADGSDRPILEHALSLARANGAELLLVHVAEGFGPRFFGRESDDLETRDDRRYLESARAAAAAQGVQARVLLRYGAPVEELTRAVEDEGVDLMVMGAHGHKLLGDLLYGSTVNPLRHRVKIPVLVVREE
jgi:manganese transport protein